MTCQYNAAYFNPTFCGVDTYGPRCPSPGNNLGLDKQWLEPQYFGHEIYGVNLLSLNFGPDVRIGPMLLLTFKSIYLLTAFVLHSLFSFMLIEVTSSF